MVIDLGTTYSCVGIDQNGRVEIMAASPVIRSSSVNATYDGVVRLPFSVAENQFGMNVKNTVFDAKRLIGVGSRTRLSRRT